MARPTGWDVLGLDGDPTPGVVESVEALAKQFGDFAHDVEAAYRKQRGLRRAVGVRAEAARGTEQGGFLAPAIQVGFP